MSDLHPKYWLTEEFLSQKGMALRAEYTAFVAYLHDTGLKPYQTGRVINLAQDFLRHSGFSTYALPPSCINLGINNKCNLKCFYCDMAQAKNDVDGSNEKSKFNLVSSGDVHLSLADMCRIVDAAAWYKPLIRTCFLEPLLYSGFFDLIDYVKSKNLKFSTLTNGLLLPKHAKAIVASGVDAIRLSLDGPKELHDSMCGVKGTYDAIMEGVKILIEEKKRTGSSIEIGFYYTITDRNFLYLKETLDALQAEGILPHVFMSFHTFTYITSSMAKLHNQKHARYCGMNIDETSSHLVSVDAIDIQALLQQREVIQREYVAKGMRVHFRPDLTENNLTQALRSEESKFLGTPCRIPWHFFYINPAGEAKPLQNCCLSSAGNALKAPLLDVWNGETMRTHRKHLYTHNSYYACQRCWGVYNNIEDTSHTWK